jgi:DNA-binding transcriptional LysR family regulator
MKFVPTNVGQCIINNGKELLLIRNNIQQQITDMRKGGSGKITIGFTIIRGISLYPVIFSIFNKKYPHIELQCLEESAEHLEKMLLDGSLDIVFINQAEQDERILYLPLFSDAMVLFLSKELAQTLKVKNRADFRYPWVELQQVESQPFIRNFPEQHNEHITQHILRDYKLTPASIIRVRNQLTAVNMATSGCGVYIATEYFINNIAAKKKPAILSFGESPSQYAAHFVAALPKGGCRTLLINDLIEIVRNTYKYEYEQEEGSLEQASADCSHPMIKPSKS